MTVWIDDNDNDDGWWIGNCIDHHVRAENDFFDDPEDIDHGDDSITPTKPSSSSMSLMSSMKSSSTETMKVEKSEKPTESS